MSEVLRGNPICTLDICIPRFMSGRNEKSCRLVSDGPSKAVVDIYKQRVSKGVSFS